jgi:hypothetical protein
MQSLYRPCRQEELLIIRMLRTSQIVSSPFLFTPQPFEFLSQIFIRISPISYDADVLIKRFPAVKIYLVRLSMDDLKVIIDAFLNENNVSLRFKKKILLKCT